MGQIRTVELRKVFSDGENLDFDAKLARICVLFEDLRIEMCGFAERSLPALDILDPEKENWISPRQTGWYRQFYFMRRSLATLLEFEEATRLIRQEIESDAGKHLTFDGLADDARAKWEAGIQFFDTNEPRLRRIRNDIGGHFGHPAARNAIANLQSGSFGHIALLDGGQEVRLQFAGEIAAAALLKHLPNGDVNEFEAFLREWLSEWYRHAIDCVYILVREYLWERFVS